MTHEWIDTTSNLLVGAISWLFTRALRWFHSMEERADKNEKEIRQARIAISRLEEHTGIPPCPYSEE